MKGDSINKQLQTRWRSLTGRGHFRVGFALPVVLMGIAGILILAGALVTVTSLERQTARAYSNTYGAEQAVRSGIAEASALLEQLTESHTYQIMQAPMAVPYDDNADGSTDDLESTSKRNYLYLVQGAGSGGNLTYDYYPLFTAESRPPSGGEFAFPENTGVREDDDRRTAVYGAEKHRLGPVVSWRILRDSEGKAVSRYAYYIEDLQGRLDTTLAGGNDDKSSSHGRVIELWPAWKNDWPPLPPTYDEENLRSFVPIWPVPGLNPSWRPGSESEHLLNQIAFFTLDPQSAGTPTDDSAFDDDLRKYGELAPSTASLISFYGIPAPLERETEGENRLRLKNAAAATIEENLIADNRPWREKALIPYLKGIDPTMMGKAKLNLNALLAKDPKNAVNEMASQIDNALPDFAEERKGGFPEDYSRTLAASALDYADTDSIPTTLEGVYRGIDSYPLINEYALTMKFRWEPYPDEEKDKEENPAGGTYNNFRFYPSNDDREYSMVTAEVFVELWNMSNHEITGKAQFNYDCKYRIDLDANPNLTFSSPILLDDTDLKDSGGSQHFLTKDEDDGHYYFPEIGFGVDASGGRYEPLKPNSFALIRVGAVRYKLDSSEAVPPSIMYLKEDEVGMSDYRMKWNGVLCDRSGTIDGGGLERNADDEPFIIGYDWEERTVYDPNTVLNICGTYGELWDFHSGMGDVRNTYWVNAVVSENAYPGNYSPNRRNVRYGSTFRWNPHHLHGRVLPSEWPDRGHDSDFELKTFHKAKYGIVHRLEEKRWRPDGLVTGYEDKPPSDDFKENCNREEGHAKIPEPDTLYGPTFVTNLGRFFSESELGNIYDPMMWKGKAWGQGGSSGITVEHWTSHIDKSSQESVAVGGGNTLRIGRPEHERFLDPNNPLDRAGQQAARLLDLFHCGMALSDDAEERTGDKVAISGHININTAPREVLRAMCAHWFYSDPAMQRAFDVEKFINKKSGYDTAETGAYRTFGSIVEGDHDYSEKAGSLYADAIIAGRPYASPSELARVRADLDGDGEPDEMTGDENNLVFGNKEYVEVNIPATASGNYELQWNDRAAEELFARVYNSSTVRSRNFRIHVIGQAVRELPDGTLQKVSECKKSFRVFVGSEDGKEKHAVKVLYETNI